MKTFRSVEFIDIEGEVVIGHGFMDDGEAQRLIDKLLELGSRDVKVYDLTPPQVHDALDVRSDHEVPRLG
jgi:acyl CoA:acetate/3-ketoacid CoA transferase alpha subunit